MVVLKKIKASTLMETLIATVLVVVTFLGVNGISKRLEDQNVTCLSKA